MHIVSVFTINSHTDDFRRTNRIMGLDSPLPLESSDTRRVSRLILLLEQQFQYLRPKLEFPTARYYCLYIQLLLSTCHPGGRKPYIPDHPVGYSFQFVVVYNLGKGEDKYCLPLFPMPLPSILVKYPWRRLFPYLYLGSFERLVFSGLVIPFLEIRNFLSIPGAVSGEEQTLPILRKPRLPLGVHIIQLQPLYRLTQEWIP